MRFIEDSFEFIKQRPGLEGMYKMIELAARTCYKTEDLITDNSYERILNKVLIPRGHTSCMEFGTVYLYRFVDETEEDWITKYDEDRYSRVECIYCTNGIHVFITTTYRTILQGDYDDPVEAIKNKFDRDWKDDLKYWSEPTEYHHKRYCYKYVMDRVGSQSVERHRGVWGISYAQESTRYINYHKDRFDSEITVAYPSKFFELINKWSKHVDDRTGQSYDYINNLTKDEQLNFLRSHDRGWCVYEESLKNDEKSYMTLVGEEGWKPEDARGVLPLDIKTEFMMCAYPEDWEMFLFRRVDQHAHPHIQKISNLLKDDYINRVK